MNRSLQRATAPARSARGRAPGRALDRLRAAATFIVLCTAALLAAPVVQAQTDTLVANLTQTDGDPVFVISPNIGVTWSAVAQQFSTGPNGSGYRIASVNIDVQRADGDGVPRIEIWETGNGSCAADGTLRGGTLQNVVEFGALSADATSSTGRKTIAAPADAVLQPNQCHFLIIYGNNEIRPNTANQGGLRLRTTASTSLDTASQANWTIVGSHLELLTGGTIAQVVDAPLLKIGINGSAINGPPSFDRPAALFTVAENGTIVGSVQARDDDIGDSITGYSISGGADQDRFDIDAATGRLSFKTAPDFEDPQDAASADPANAADNNEYVVLVTATSGAGARAMTVERDQIVVVTVTDVSNETPSTKLLLSLSPSEVDEDVGSAGRTVTVTATLDEAARSDPVDVTVTVAGNTAVAGTDFTAVSDFSLTIPAGARSASETFNLVPIDNDVGAVDKTLTISGSTTASGLTVESATLTIRNDEVTEVTGVSIPSKPERPPGANDGVDLEDIASYLTGDTIGVSVAFSGEVDVTGTPRVALRIGDAVRYAGYASGTGTNTLVFDYTVTREDGDDNGVSIPEDALALNGGTIRTMGTAVDANLDHNARNYGGAYSVNRPYLVGNGIHIASRPAEGDTYRRGETIRLRLTFNENVNVTTDTDGCGPRLRVHTNSARTHFVDACAEASSASPDVFVSYTVRAADPSTGQIRAFENRLAADGGSIVSSARGTKALLGHERRSAGSLDNQEIDGRIALRIEDAVAAEGSPAVFTVTLSHAPSDDLSVTWSTSDNTATAGDDYTAQTARTLTFGAGVTSTTISVPTLTDEVDEHQETFEVELGSVPTGFRKARGTARGTITDLPIVRIASDGDVDEGGAAAFTLTRTGDTSAALPVNVSVSEVGAVLQGTTPTSVTFAMGAATAALSVATEDDALVERAGIVTVRIGERRVNSRNTYTIGTSSSAAVTVRDNDGGEDDASPPRVASIARHMPSSQETNADSLTWRVTFSEDVQNVTADDFTVAGPTGAVLAVTALSGSNRTYDVTASGGDLASLNRTVTLALDPDQDIEDLVGRALTDTAPTGAAENTYEVDNAVPVFLTAAVNGTVLTLTYNEALDEGSVPAGSAYAVKVGGGAADLAGSGPVTVSGSAVTLTLETAVTPGQTVTVAYAKPTGDSAKPLRDPAGNEVATFAARGVTNDTPEAVKPRLGRVERLEPSSSPTRADSLTWRVTFSEDVQNVTADDFAVSGTTASLSVSAVGGSMSVYDVTASGGDLAGLDGTVTLSLASGQDIDDLAGNALDTGATPRPNEASYALDNTGPTLDAALVRADGVTLVLTFNEILDGRAPNRSRFTVMAGGETVNVSNRSVSVTTVTLALGATVHTGQTVTVSYEDPSSADNSNALQDRLGNDVASFDDEEVTNDSGQESPANRAMGVPTISGEALVGEELTASIDGITDVNGLENVDWRYQWLRVDGTTETGIADATSSTYTLQRADAGKTIKVRVTFDDDEGFGYALTSAAYPSTGSVAADVTLSSLTLSDGTLSPAFSADEDTYTASVTGSVSFITVTPVVNVATAGVTYFDEDDDALEDARSMTEGHQVDLAVGPNVIKIKVIDQDDTTEKIYTVTVTRAAPCVADDILCGVLVAGRIDSSKNGFNQNAGSLSALSFVYDNTTYTVSELSVDRRGGRQLSLIVSPTTGGLYDDDTGLVLHFGDRSYNFDDASGVTSFRWSSSVRSLSQGQYVAVRITGEETTDTTAPQVSSITRHSPDSSPTRADSLTWRVTFSEDVRNVGTADFSLTGTTATLAVSAMDSSKSVYDVTASGGDLASLDATVELSLASGQDIEDLAGNTLDATATPDPNETTYVLDNTAPPAPRAAVNGAALTLTFNEALDPGSVPAGGAFTVTVAGAGAGLAGNDPVAVSGSEVTLTLDTAVTHGQTVTVAYAKPGSGDKLQDEAGNEVATFSALTVTNNTAEAVKPTISSIERQSPSTSPTNADSLTWRVTFSEDVQNVGTADFTLTGTTAALSVSAMDSSKSVYDVTASGGNLADLDATVTLVLASGQDIEDLVGNTLDDTATPSPNDTSYVLDNTAPPAPSAAVGGAELTLTFNEALDQDSVPAGGAFTVMVAGSGADLAGSDPVTVSGSEVTLTLDTAVTHGQTVTVAYTKPTGDSAKPLRDPAGNEVASFTAIDVTNKTPEAVRPTVSSIERQSPSTSPTNADSLTWRVTFSEDVQNVGTADFTLTGTTAALSVSAMDSSKSVYDVTASGGNLAGLDATVTLVLASGQDIEDLVGNTLDDTATPSPNDTSYVLDNTAPPAPRAAVNGAALTLTFNEALDPGSVPAGGAFTVTVAGAGAGLAGNDPVAVSGSEVTLTLDTAVTHGQTVTVAYTKPTGDSAKPLRDPAGNEVATLSALTVTNNTAEAVKPTIRSIARHNPDSSPTDADSLTWRVTFSEDVRNVGTADFAVSGTTASLSVSAMGSSNSVYDVTASGGDLASLDATVELSLASGQDIEDLAGNTLDANATPAPNETTYVLDNTAPPAPSAAVDGAALTLTFNEALDPGSVPAGGAFTVMVAGAGAGLAGSDPVAVSGSEVTLTLDTAVTHGQTVTVAYTKPTGDSAKPLRDPAGNEVASFTAIDVTNKTPEAVRPTVSSIERQTPSTSPTRADSLTWRVTFSEDVRNVGTADFAVSGTTASLSVSAMGSSNSVYDFTASGGDLASLDATVELSLASGQDIEDLAGNTLDATATPSPNEITYVLDNTAPPAPRAAVNGAALTLTFNEALDPGSVPAGGAFTVMVAGAGAGLAGNDPVAVSGSEVTLTLDTAVTHGQTVTVAYTKPTGDSAKPLRDPAGNEVASFTAIEVTNKTPEAVRPTVSSIGRQSPSTSPTNADSLTWRVTFSEDVQNVGTADFTLTGTTATLAVAAMDSSKSVYDVTASGGDLASLDATVELSLASGQDIEDLAGNTLDATATPSPNEITYVLDNTAPSERTYTAPASLKVGVAIAAMSPSATTDTDIDAYRATGLPSGLSIDASTGSISGTPDTADAGTRSATVTITDTAGNTRTVSVAFPAVAKGDQTLSGFAYSKSQITLLDSVPTLTAPTGAQTTLQYSAAPSGVCTVDSGTGTLTVAGAGTCTVTATAPADANWNEAAAAFALTVTTAGTLTLNVAAIATDDTVNIAEKAAGFAISGDTGSVGGVSISVEVGSATLTATSSTEDPATWTVSVPAAASYITGTSVGVTVSASKTGYTAASEVTRTLTVDLVAPQAPSYTAPSSLEVGVAIADLAPSGGSGVESYSAAGLPSGLRIDASTGVIDGTPEAASANSATATVTASDEAGNTDTVSVAFPAVAKGDQTLSGFAYSKSQITLLDSVPTLTAPTGAQTTLQYSASPSGVCTVDSGTGALTVAGAGTCTVTATAPADANWNEAAATFALTVTTAGTLTLNVAAIATDDTVNIAEKAAGFAISGDTGSVGGVSVSVEVGSATLTATSSTEDPATWTVSVPAAASYITGTSVGVTVSASKTGYTAASEVTRTLTVDLVAPQAPSYTAPSSLEVGVAIADLVPSGGSGVESYSAAGLPSGLSIDASTGVIDGTPEAASANSATATVTASDEAGNTDTVSVAFPAVAKGDQTLSGFAYSKSQITLLDSVPTLTAPTGAQTTLQYSASPSGVCTVDSGTGALTVAGAGTCTVTATAPADANWNEAAAAFALTVTTAGTLTLNVAAIATDDTVNIAEKAAGFAISGDTGSVGGVSISVEVGSATLTGTSSTEDPATWTVSVPAAASYITGTSVDVTVSASKTGYTAASEVTRTLTVDLVAPQAPSYTVPSSLEVGVAIAAMSPSATMDTDIDAYRAMGLPSGLSIAASTGSISGTPDTADANTRSATVTITDTAGNTRTVSVAFPAVAKGDQTLSGFAYSKSQITLLDSVPTLTAPTGAQTTLQYSAAPSGVCTVDSGTGALTVVGAGTCTVTATAPADANWNEATATFTLTVRAANTAPAASDGEVATDEDTAYAFEADNFNFTDADAGDALASVKVTGLPAAGTGVLVLDGTAVAVNDVVSKADLDAGKLVYNPPVNANGNDYARFRFRVSDGTAESTSAYTMTIDVTAVNDAATGKPGISGTARVGETLSASTAGISDADGLDDVDYGYRWMRVDADGASNAQDVGTDSSTYTLEPADAGGKIRVEVRFSDDAGNAEVLVSDAYPSSASVLPDIGNAEAVWSGTLVVQSLSANFRGCSNSVQNGHCSTGSILDEDEFSYDGDRYAIETLQLQTGGANARIGRFLIQFSTDLPSDADEFRLHVGNRTFDFGSADNKTDRTRRWDNSGLTLQTGYTLSLMISRPSRTPLKAELRQLRYTETNEAAEILRYTMKMTLSEKVWVPWRKMRDHTFTVQGGRVTSVRRLNRSTETIDDRRRSVASRWNIEVKPDEPDGTVRVTLESDRACDDDGALCSLTGRRLERDVTLTLRPVAASRDASIAASIADTTANEDDGVMLFEVTLSEPPKHWHEVWVRTTDRGTATEGVDFRESGDLLVLFTPGVVSQEVGVLLLDDTVDDDRETVIMEIIRAIEVIDVMGIRRAITIADGEAVGTIRNSDEFQKAWIARFGRSVASQAVDAVGERLSGTGKIQATLGGFSLRASANAGTLADTEANARAGANAMWLRGESGEEAPSGSLTGRELLLGSSFSSSVGGEKGAARFGAWGRFSSAEFDADVDGLSLDGGVTSAFIGADVESGRWLAGAALGLSEGDAPFGFASEGDPEGREGEIESALTGVYPYVEFSAGERLSLWAMGGLGEGTMTLSVDGAPPLETDISMRMGAAGANGTLVSPPPEGGVALAVKSDALFVRMKSDALRSDTGNLAAASADVSRLRLIVEGSRAFALGEEGTLTPALEVGLRHDSGDAETGTGIEVGGRLGYTRPGVSVEGAVRALLAHEASGYEEWGAAGALRIDPGASGRGLSFTLSPTWGNAGSAAGRLWGTPDARGLAPDGAFEAGRRLDAELGYGLRAHPGVVTPFTGLGLEGGGARRLRLGARWALGAGTRLDFEGVRNEAGNDDVDQRLGLTFSTRW